MPGQGPSQWISQYQGDQMRKIQSVMGLALAAASMVLGAHAQDKEKLTDRLNASATIIDQLMPAPPRRNFDPCWGQFRAQSPLFASKSDPCWGRFPRYR